MPYKTAIQDNVIEILSVLITSITILVFYPCFPSLICSRLTRTIVPSVKRNFSGLRIIISLGLWFIIWSDFAGRFLHVFVEACI